MKRIFALILVLMLCFCASAEPKTIDLETMTLEELEAHRAEVDAAISALQETGVAEEAEAAPDGNVVQIELGDTLTFGDVDMSFKSCAVANEIVENLFGETISGDENCMVAYVYGTTKAGDEEFYNLDNHATFEIVLDGQYTFNAFLLSGHDWYAEYLATGKLAKDALDFWLYADVHNDLLADYESLVLRIYYRESYSYEDSQTHLDADSADVIYELDMTPDALTEYTDKATIKAVQAAMNELGFECGTPDGVSGKKTAAAISAFQAENGLTETGTVTHETLQALRAMGLNV